MKKKTIRKLINYNLAFFLLTLSSHFNLNAQITITQSDMPSAYDGIIKSSALNLQQYDFQQTGENYIWDYSGLQPISQAVDTFMRVTDTPLMYWPFFLLNANLASPALEDSPIPELPLSDVFRFFNSSSNNYRDVGFAAMISGLPLPFAFEAPDILYDFPMNYGNVDSSESGYSFGLPDIAFILVDRKRVNTVDGWGTLITPYGSFDVLRLRSEVTEYDSIYIDSLNVGLPINREYTEYKWLGKDQKIPLLFVTDDLLSLGVDYVDSARFEVVGINRNEGFSLSENRLVYPNPTSGIVHIQLDDESNGPIEYYLFDLTGKLIFSSIQNALSEQSGQYSMDLRNFNLENGYYILRIKKGAKQYVVKLNYQPS